MIGSPEFQLAVECCRRNFSNVEPRPLPRQVDWARFQKFARFHRIEGLAHMALRAEPAVPTDLAGSLAHAAASIAAHNLRSAVASQSLLQEFRKAGVSALFVKGLTLGALAYGNPMLKSAVDIDILVTPADLEAAANCLRATGFSLITPTRSLVRWHRSWKESVWAKDGSVQLDLHTRLADNARLLRDLDANAAPQLVPVGRGIDLPTLGDDELFSYLAIHGASACWFRLKWISDFAAFLAGRPLPQIHQWYKASQARGAGRAAGQALLVADALFDSLANLPDLAHQLRNDRTVARLSRIALALISRTPAEPTERRFGTLPIHVSQLALQPGLSFMLSQVTQQGRQFLTRITI